MKAGNTESIIWCNHPLIPDIMSLIDQLSGLSHDKSIEPKSSSGMFSALPPKIAPTTLTILSSKKPPDNLSKITTMRNRTADVTIVFLDLKSILTLNPFLLHICSDSTYLSFYNRNSQKDTCTFEIMNRLYCTLLQIQ